MTDPAFDPAVRAALVARELSLPAGAVARTLLLLDGGATVPFIARYRKEATQGLDDAAIQRVSDHAHTVGVREARRASIVESVREQGALTTDLEQRLLRAGTLAELEDLYLPFKPKRRTRAQAAREKGLEPLAKLILAQGAQAAPRDQLAAQFFNASLGVPDSETAFALARDIVAELIAERADLRAEVRKLFAARSKSPAARAKRPSWRGTRTTSATASGPRKRPHTGCSRPSAARPRAS